MSSPPSHRGESVYRMSSLTRCKTVAMAREEAQAESDAGTALSRVLGVWDVIFMGCSSTVGAGIFVVSGAASLSAGPAVTVSFLLASFACLLSAFSYAEFAARCPVAGSAYSFAYLALGELCAFFIGWNLTLEYSISASAVARGWAGNFALFMEHAGAPLPTWLYALRYGSEDDTVSILSVLIIVLCTLVLTRGISESSKFNMAVTVMNISLISFIIILGSTRGSTSRWTKHDGFFPTGLNGVVTGAAQVFFSYVGFDSVTTLAEEVTNPRRDLPIGIIGTLAVATSLYAGASLTLTAMVPWDMVNKDTPLASAFVEVGLPWAGTLIAAVSVTALTVTTLVSLVGQARVFMRMARDGLFFRVFGRVNPVTKVPMFGTVATSVGASVIALMLNIEALSNMISIGTLLAFATVCAGVVILRYEGRSDGADGDPNGSSADWANVATGNGNGNGNDGGDGSFVPLDPSLSISATAPLTGGESDRSRSPRRGSPQHHQHTAAPPPFAPGDPTTFIGRCRNLVALRPALCAIAVYIPLCVAFSASLRRTDTCPIPVIVFLGILCCLPVILLRYKFPQRHFPPEGSFLCPMVPALPMLGIFTNIYLIASLDIWSYVRIAVWTAIGFVIYFAYGIRHSKLNGPSETAARGDLLEENEGVTGESNARQGQ